MSSNMDSEDTRPLLPGVSEYEYTSNREEFHQILNKESTLFKTNQTHSQYILFTNIATQIFLTDFLNTPESEESLLPYSIDSYYPEPTSTLLLKLNSKPQLEGYNTLTTLLTEKLIEMNHVQRALHYSTPNAYIQTPSRWKMMGGGAEAEFLPRIRPTGRSSLWPTVVFESGCYYPGFEVRVEADAKWWIEESNGYVNTTLMVLVHRDRWEVVIQKWGLTDRSTTATRQNTGRQVAAGLQEEVVISRCPDEEDGISVRGGNGGLVLGFEKLFLRPPAAAGEGDIVFTDDDLRHLADMVWSLQEEE